ncbi:MAG TPA: hypothetical protein VL137_04270 [Polyangiaceae bacterium]|nr:hypothetical protein [Polyangiaceae bacterium]
MSADESTGFLLQSLTEAGIEFIVVGMTAGVLLGVPAVTQDVDIVHRRTADNVERLLHWLLSHNAYHRLDLAGRRLPPTREALLGTGHLNLQTDIGMLDVLCELSAGAGYEQLVADSVLLDDGSTRIRVLDLPRLIAEKTRVGRPKDRAILPLLIATLDEQKRLRDR